SQGEIDRYLNSIGGERALVGDTAPRRQAEPQTPRLVRDVPTPPAGTETGEGDGSDDSEATIAAEIARTPVPEIEAPAPRPVAGLQELEVAFQQVQKQKAVDAELDELLAEFRAAI